MAATWSEIFPDVDGPPVRGEPGDFRRAQHSFETMRDDAQDALDQFNKITSDDGISQLRGQAATAFERFVREVADSLGDLPRVSDEAASVFNSHAAALTDLRDEVDRALARAQTNWNEKRRLTSQIAQSDQRLKQLQDQIDQLPTDGADPTTDAQRTTLGGDQTDAQSHANSLSTQLGDVESALRGIRGEWTDFHGREATLRKHTRDALDDIDLGDLKDPGRFSSFISGAFDFVMDMSGLDELWDLIQDIANGDWAAVLWKLREVLDAVLLVLAVVALFTPLGPIVLAVAIGLAVAKLAIDVALYSTKWPNPDTGEVVSMTDIIMDGVMVATLGYGKYLQVAGKFNPTVLQLGKDMWALRGANAIQRAEILSPYGVAPVFEYTNLANGLPHAYISGWTGVNKFVILKGNSVRGAVTNLVKLPAVTLSNPRSDTLSTDIFNSIANGHSEPKSVPEKLTVHIAPFTVTNTTCAPA